MTNNHQEANARQLEKAGAAKVILEKDLSGRRLYRYIGDIMGDISVQKEMSEKSRSLGKPDSANLIVREMRRLTAHR